MDIKRPYFMENKEWYIYDNVKGIVGLTEKAPQKAVESYKQYLLDKEEEMPYSKKQLKELEELKAKKMFGI